MCEECTGYGSSCVNSANQDNRVPGQYVATLLVVVVVVVVVVVIVVVVVVVLSVRSVLGTEAAVSIVPTRITAFLDSMLPLF